MDTRKIVLNFLKDMRSSRRSFDLNDLLAKHNLKGIYGVVLLKSGTVTFNGSTYSCPKFKAPEEVDGLIEAVTNFKKDSTVNFSTQVSKRKKDTKYKFKKLSLFQKIFD